MLGFLQSMLHWTLLGAGALVPSFLCYVALFKFVSPAEPGERWQGIGIAASLLVAGYAWSAIVS